MAAKYKGHCAAVKAGSELVDARSKALTLMSEALARLDSDRNIPPAVGAQLQSAMDALWTSGAAGQRSIQLH